MLRIGLGVDVHSFAENRKLIIGGIEIPYKLGLAGHSDADVLIHAICDALLGAAALPDIGQFFPDTDKKYKNIDSKILLKNVVEKIRSKNYKIVNIDAVILAQSPKLADYIQPMRKTLAQTIDIDNSLINIKATTTENLGFVGENKGIEARSVCLLTKI